MLILLLTPMLFLAGIGVICTKILNEKNHVEFFDIAIVDNDQTIETKYVIQQLLDSGNLSKAANVHQVDEHQAMALMEKNEIAAMVVIPEGFSEDVKTGTNTPVKVIGNASKPLQSQLVLHVLESAARLTSAAQSGINTVYHFLKEENSSSEVLQAEYKKNILSFSLHILGRGEIFEVKEKQNLFQQDIVQYYVLSFYLLLIMIWSFGFSYLLKGKSNESLRLRLYSRGITGFEEKIASLATSVVYLTFISILLSIPILMWIDQPISRSIVMATLLIVLTFVSFFMMVETLVSSEKLYLLAGIGLIIMGAIAGGHIIPTVYFPAWLENIGLYTINSWAFEFLLAIVGESSGLDAMKKVGMIAIFCILITGVVLKLDKKRFGW